MFGGLIPNCVNLVLGMLLFVTDAPPFTSPLNAVRTSGIEVKTKADPFFSIRLLWQFILIS